MAKKKRKQKYSEKVPQVQKSSSSGRLRLMTRQVGRGEGFLTSNRQNYLKRPRGKPDNGLLEHLVISSEHKDLSSPSFDAIFLILCLIQIYMLGIYTCSTAYEHFFSGAFHTTRISHKTKQLEIEAFIQTHRHTQTRTTNANRGRERKSD